MVVFRTDFHPYQSLSSEHSVKFNLRLSVKYGLQGTDFDKTHNRLIASHGDLPYRTSRNSLRNTKIMDRNSFMALSKVRLALRRFSQNFRWLDNYLQIVPYATKIRPAVCSLILGHPRGLRLFPHTRSFFTS